MSDAPGPGLHSALTRHIGYLLSRVAADSRRRFGARLETLGLTFHMWGALNVLGSEPELTQTALSGCLGIDPSSMVATIDELERRGLVERGRHPTDRRAHAVRLTAHGRRTLQRGRELARESHDEVLAPLSAADRRELHRLLLELAQGAGAPVRGRSAPAQGAGAPVRGAGAP